MYHAFVETNIIILNNDGMKIRVLFIIIPVYVRRKCSRRCEPFSFELGEYFFLSLTLPPAPRHTST